MIVSFLGLNGRVSRLTWWTTQLFITATGITYSLAAAAPAFGPSHSDTKTAEDISKVVAELTWASIQDPVLLALMVANYWLFTTSSVQRLHDRGKSGWAIALAFVPLFLLVFAVYLFIGPQALVAGVIAVMLALASQFVVVLWLIIACGILSGDDADNAYGPSTGKAARRAAFAEELAAMSLARDVTTSRMEGGYGTYAAPTPALATSPGHGRPVFGKL
jgi:uncharacterized membrane protein YhaH (DUF805 family)